MDSFKQMKSGDILGGIASSTNTVTGVISGLASNQGTKLPLSAVKADNTVGKDNLKAAQANNNFYANIGVNLGFNKSSSNSKSHSESGVVTTIKGKDENSSITYNNVKNIEYVGTQAKDTKFIYNNVENITKKAVELNNSYSSNSKSTGVSAGVTIGYGDGVQTEVDAVKFSASKSKMNTNGTKYQNGLFVNVDEVHNNTKNMTLSGFNQVGGKVTGNIQNLTIESKQNTSTTTGSTKGGSIGFAPNGMPSLSANYSQTNGEKKYVDDPTTFIIGNGSNLKVGKVENTAGAIGATEDGKLSIDEYIGHNLENNDETTTKGGSLSVSPNSNVISGVGINYANRDLESVTKNTVVGNVEIGKSSGDEINKDLSTMTEVTKDKDTRTNVFVESQTIKYALNPEVFKEDLKKAKNEITDMGNVVENTVNPKGEDKRNIFANLRAQRWDTSFYNVTGSRMEELSRQFKAREINEKQLKEAARDIVKGYGKDIGIDYEVVYLDESTMPKDAKGSTGSAYILDEKNRKVLIPIDVKKIKDTGDLFGTIAEEVSHGKDALEGRQDKKVAEDETNKEKGLESLGRPANDYVKNKLGDDNNSNISLTTDGIDLTNVNVGEKVGDVELIRKGINGYNEYNEAVKDIELSIEAIKDKNKEYLEVAERIGKDGLLNEMSKEYNELNISEVSKKMFVVYGGSDEIRKLYLQKEKNSKGEIVDMLILDDFIPKDMADLWAAPETSRELRKIGKYWKKELLTKDSVTISYQNRVRDETAAYPNFTQKSNSKFYALGRTKLYQSTYGNIKRLENGKYDVAITVIFQYVDRFEDAKNINLFSNDGKNKNKEFKGGKGFSIKTKPKPVTIVKQMDDLSEIDGILLDRLRGIKGDTKIEKYIIKDNNYDK